MIVTTSKIDGRRIRLRAYRGKTSGLHKDRPFEPKKNKYTPHQGKQEIERRVSKSLTEAI